MIAWPCILKLDGDHELMFIDTYAAFDRECRDLIWSNQDRVIDSAGHTYRICQASPKDPLTLQQFGDGETLQTITELIQAHEFSKAEMCLTKIQFPSMSAAISSLSAEA